MSKRAVADLSKQIRPRRSGKTFRLGVIDSKVTGPPATVTVGDRTMRVCGSISNYTVGETVVWVDEGSTPFVIGQLAP